MPRNSSGTMSLPAGNPVVSGTTVSSSWANSTLGDLSTEMTDSLSRSGKGGMTAPLRTTDGTVAAPAHSFTNETGTGVYRKGASNPAIAVNGAERQEWTSAGSRVSGTFEATGNTTVGGTLGVTGAISAGGALDMNSHAISEVADPSNAQDAASKNYVDVTAGTSAATASALMRRDASGRVAVAAPSASGDAATKGYVDGLSDGTASISSGANWIVTGGGFTTLVKSANGIVTFTFSGNAGAGASASPAATLPAGYRPTGDVHAVGNITSGGTGFAGFTINSAGTVSVINGFVVSRIYSFSVSFKAA